MDRRKYNRQSDNTDRWLLTYSDLITLLLAFFVIMYSMSEIDARKFGKMSERLQSVFRGSRSAPMHNAKDSDMGAGVLKVGRLKLIQQRIRKLSGRIGRNRHNLKSAIDDSKPAISAEINERGLVIRILESALFESGKADLKPSAIEALDLIATEIAGLPNHVRVEGHTDNQPISTALFPTNWELSTARSTTIVRYFVEVHNFPADRISALGYGEFRPYRSNATADGKAQNRRVDVVVLTEELSRLEPQASTNSKQQTTGNNLLFSTENSSPN